jgi:hypothetical protein
MITRRETLNEIATLRYNGRSLDYIAKALNLALKDVVAAVVAFKL